jgi:hypothetical protein
MLNATQFSLAGAFTPMPGNPYLRATGHVTSVALHF